jgi:hypothetical protein
MDELRQLDVATIFEASKQHVQRRLRNFRDAGRAAEILAMLDERVQQNKPHAHKRRARFLECQREHASAWLTASRRDKDCCMINGHFRIAVAIRLGINPFAGVPSTMQCTWCKNEVGDDVFSHTIECASAQKGDNNRRHQFLQQVLANLLRAIAEGAVHLVPQVLAFFGAGAHETGSANPVTALARDFVKPKETAEQNSRRQGDIGLEGVFERGQLEIVDLTVSDGGGAAPSGNYVPGRLCTKRAHDKHFTYRGDGTRNGRFAGILREQLTILSFDCMGGMTTETKEWLQHLIKALAAAEPSTFRSTIASRVWSRVSVSLQSSLARNALAFRNGKLQGPARKVGLSQPSQSQQSQQGGAAGGARRLLRRAVQQRGGNLIDGDDFQDQDLDVPNGERIAIPARTGDDGGDDSAEDEAD